MFSKDKSLICKGIAIILMMWHHCFISGRYDGYVINFFPFTEQSIVEFADFGKLCVSLFVFISGYGLCASYSKMLSRRTADDSGKLRADNHWVLSRLLKTLAPFWLVAIILVLVSMVIDARPLSVYKFEESNVLGIFNALIDISGLGNFFGIAKLSEDWWYMSAAIVYIILVPFLFYCMKKSSWLVITGILMMIPRIGNGYPGSVNFMSFLPTFFLGMVFSHYSVFDKWQQLWQPILKKPIGHVAKFAIMATALILYYSLYKLLPNNKFWDFKWALMLPILLFFIADYISIIPVLKSILQYLGKHSANIFYIHTFIRLYYCKNALYGLEHFALIIVVLLGSSLICSIIVEILKKIIFFDRFISIIDKRISRNVNI